METVDKFKKVLEELKVNKTNIIKDNQERRKNLELTHKRLADIDKFSDRLDLLKLEASKDFSNLDVLDQIKKYVNKIDNIIIESRNILKDRLKIDIKMGEKFDLKTAGSLLPVMDGSEDTTKKLLDSIELYSELLQADDQKFLITYVLKTRLSENAKIRLNKQYTSVNALIKDIRDNYVTKKSATTLSMQLHQARQLNKSVTEFGQEIEQLLSDLTLSQAGDDDNLLISLRGVNEKIAINSFCNGVRNHDLRTILKSRNCKSLKDVISVALDEERNKPSSSNMFYFNKSSNNNQGFQFRSGRGSRNRGQLRACRPFNHNRGGNFRGSYNQYSNSNPNNQSNKSNLNNFNQRGNRSRGRFQSGRQSQPSRENVWTANSEENSSETQFFRE